MGSDLTDPAIDLEPFLEIDPSGRYGRYGELLGSGAVKKVYRAFDLEEGIEVAWNRVKLSNFRDNETMIHRFYAEVELLGKLNHKNIIALHSAWTDEGKNSLNFITEVCTSGNLRDYRRKHRHVSLKALKKWSRQILSALNYLHTHDPCVIHRDLNCSNIFVNGSTGQVSIHHHLIFIEKKPSFQAVDSSPQVKIGDLGFAAVVGENHAAHSLLGTPEFMAPELYDEDYTELIDIYSFGMCLLEMVTLELPYSECDNIVKIYKKVVSGLRPRAMDKVRDAQVAAFIEKCLAQPRARPSAAELLRDPFFEGIDDENR
ncbi:hypothetical protein M569_14090 [Genlisea aurea]|uniref:non-specific serine/threonine protein kinase n=1 Tax=Genlisea aurea TaxID=192259 RepID=S8DD25_9LAMI|nr:hypothetical protein M569_14090 [Genlisea aurea]